MAGTIISIEGQVGEVVDAEETIAIMESMKMEMSIVAPAAGTISEILVAEGDAVVENQPLVRII
jgi:biotin carboxyl carrier protein